MDEQKQATSRASLLHQGMEFLSAAKQNPAILKQPQAREVVLKLIAEQLGEKTSDLSHLSSIAIDSLTLIEIVAQLRRRLGLKLSVTDVANAGTLGGVIKSVLDVLQARCLSGDEKS